MEVSTAAKGNVNKLKQENLKTFYGRKCVNGKITNDKCIGKVTEMQLGFRKININIVTVLMNLSSIQLNYIQVYPVLEYKYAGANAISPITQRVREQNKYNR